jgi:hypothetical protein
MSQKCELINERSIGEVTLSLRSLSRWELAYLIALCTVDWRLGGGKPLGLGHCRPLSVELVDADSGKLEKFDLASEDLGIDRSAPAPVPAAFRSEIDPVHLDRLKFYQATQRPVKLLRYPRLHQDGSRGGHAWFQRNAVPKVSNDHGSGSRGLRVLPVTGPLQVRAGAPFIQAQALPRFNPKDHLADVLYGYDIQLAADGRGHDTRWTIRDSDSGSDFRPPQSPGKAPPSPNRDSRQRERDQRS